MKTIIQQTTLAAALSFGLIAGNTSSAGEDAAQTVTEQRQTGAFRAIELFGPYHVVIKAQGRNSVALSGQREQLAGVETVVSGGTLIVRPVSRTSFFFGFGKQPEARACRSRPRRSTA